MKQSGFSLVELAIVLVIIGLITGGILTGQDLIKASELNRLYADANKFKLATNTFKLKYNALPGDIANATAYWGTETVCPSTGISEIAGTCNGNKDGFMETGRERYRAWEHLSLSGLIPGSYVGRLNSTAPLVVPDINTPSGALNSAYVFLGMPSASTMIYNQVGNAITVTDPNSASFLTPAELASIDGKYDDGKPAFGKITTYNATTQANCVTSDTASTAEYNLSYTAGAVCYSAIFWF